MLTSPKKFIRQLSIAHLAYCQFLIVVKQNLLKTPFNIIFFLPHIIIK